MFNENKKKAHVIVVGNEKGGAGKTTTTIHLISYLLNLGFNIASFDLDSRQKSLTRYLENRSKYSQKGNLNLRLPSHFHVAESNALDSRVKENEERNNFFENFYEACNEKDFVIIDTPGSNTYLSRIAHSHGDTIVTPVNDSFLDMDVLAEFEPETYNIIKPSIYSETIWKQKIERAKRDNGEINWIVVRNRLSNIDAKNKRNVGQALAKLSNKVGFRVAEGFSERVIFKELFLYGLTLFDLGEEIFEIKLTISHIAAKEELKRFLAELKIPQISTKLEKKEQKQLATV